MAMVLYSGEMIAAARQAKLPDAEALERKIIEANNEMANALCQYLGITTSGASWDTVDLGVAAAFFAKHEDQPCPEVIRRHDEEGYWHWIELTEGES